MIMNKLTWELKDGGIFVDKCDIREVEFETNEKCFTGTAIKKLAFYEDRDVRGCKCCFEGEVDQYGIERYESFENISSRTGIVYKENNFIYKTNGRYFFETEYYTNRVYFCPMCGRTLELPNEA